MSAKSLVDEIASAWSWTGLRPRTVVAESDFGNLVLEDVEGRFWRICPEELSCRVVAPTRADWDQLSVSAEFREDWLMAALVGEAQARLGLLETGRKYCLKIPAVLGGAYGGDNLATIALTELIGASGDMARQMSKRITIVGEPTCGSSGQPLQFSIYGAFARVCTKWDRFPDGTEFVGIGVLPDVRSARSVRDVALGRDAVLQTAPDLLSKHAESSK